MKAVWNNVVLAESTDTVVVEGNHYFPSDSLNNEYFQNGAHTSYCPSKGTASYYSISVGDQVNNDAAWFYADPKEAAVQIKDHVAFWKGVEVSE